MKKQYVIKLIVCFILTVILITGNIIQSFATESGSAATGSGAAGDWSGAQKADFITDNLLGLAANTVGIIFGRSSTQDLATNFEQLIRAKTIEENIDYDTWWSQNVGLTPNNPQAPSVSEPNDLNVTNINVSYEFKDILLQAAQETMAENQLGYVESYVVSGNYLDTSGFSDYANFQQIKNIILSNNGYTFTRRFSSGSGAARIGMFIVTVDTSKYPVSFIGSTSGGNFSNVSVEHNWATISQLPENTDGITIYFYYPNNHKVSNGFKTYAEAKTDAGYNYSLTYPNMQNVKNLSNPNASETVVFSSKQKNEKIYVFENINAYKNYNSGSPQPYYVSSSYTGAVTSGNSSYTTSQVNSGNSSYSNVVNNIQTGMSAEDVIKLVDTVMNNMNNGGGSGGGSGGSGGSDDDDDNESIIGNIIEKLGNFVAGIIEGIGNALGSIVNVIVGYTDDQGVEHPGIFQGLIDLISSGVVGFIGAVFSFLPTEIVTVITAGIVLSILFAVIHFIRGR